MYNLEHSQYHKRDRRRLHILQDLQLLVYMDRFRERDCWAIDTPMVYLREHLLMPADDPELQW